MAQQTITDVNNWYRPFIHSPENGGASSSREGGPKETTFFFFFFSFTFVHKGEKKELLFFTEYFQV